MFSSSHPSLYKCHCKLFLLADIRWNLRRLFLCRAKIRGGIGEKMPKVRTVTWKVVETRWHLIVKLHWFYKQERVSFKVLSPSSWTFTWIQETVEEKPAHSDVQHDVQDHYRWPVVHLIRFHFNANQTALLSEMVPGTVDPSTSQASNSDLGTLFSPGYSLFIRLGKKKKTDSLKWMSVIQY